MKITILGSGSAYGTPYALNRWLDGVDKNNKKNYRLRSSIYLEDGNDKLLVDCGPDFRQQTINNNITEVKNIFITHPHTDHIMGIWDLTKCVKTQCNEVNLYGDSNTLKTITARFPFIFDEDFDELDQWRIKLNKVNAYSNKKIKNTSMEIIPLKFNHFDIYSFGFRYKNVVISPDMDNIPQSTQEHLYNLDLWVLECNNIVHRDNGHTNLEQAMEFIKKYKPKKAIFTHLSAEADYETMSKKLPENVILAYDGLVYEI